MKWNEYYDFYFFVTVLNQKKTKQMSYLIETFIVSLLRCWFLKCCEMVHGWMVDISLYLNHIVFFLFFEDCYVI